YAKQDTSGKTSASVACVATALMVDSLEPARHCAEYALGQGRDSTFHLLALSRIASLHGDTADAITAVASAIASARDSGAKALLLWHLRWLATPAELGLARQDPALAGEILTQLLARRDLSEGRPVGAMLVEYFTRLHHADSQFR